MENKQALEVLVPLLEITRGDVHEAIEAAVRVLRATADKPWAKEYGKEKKNETWRSGRTVCGTLEERKPV